MSFTQLKKPLKSTLLELQSILCQIDNQQSSDGELSKKLIILRDSIIKLKASIDNLLDLEIKGEQKASEEEDAIKL